MRSFCSARHRLQDGHPELTDGRIQPSEESVARVENILAAVKAAGIGPTVEPHAYDSALSARLHESGYLRFLETVADEWIGQGFEGAALSSFWRPRMTDGIEPANIHGRLGFYSYDGACPVQAGTWEAVKSAAACAVSAARSLEGAVRSSFSLARPPGHHAHRACMGGFSYLNNAGLAAQALRDGGAGRVAILDVDAHHGNGTQDVFYDRDDVLFVSLHTDTRHDYPFYGGTTEERGRGLGEGFTLNLPLQPREDWAVYGEALETACRAINGFGADALVVSLGVDIYRGDPGGQHGLAKDDFRRLGERLGLLGRPTVFVMEGGYDLATIGENVVAVLTSFAGAHRDAPSGGR